MKAKSWKDIDAQAEHYKAIGQTEIYLSRYDGCEEYPWEFVTKCEGGSSHRLDISTDINFYAKVPSGLMFRWFHDIEPRSANGSGSYHIDTLGIKAIFPLIPRVALASLKEYLADCATKVRARADEQNEYIMKQYGMAAELEALSR